MAHKSSVPLREKPAHVLRGETPRTLFRDEFDSIRADLIYYPDNRIDLVAYAFQKATWSNEIYIPGKDKKKDKEITDKLQIEAMKGNGLPLSLELYDFVFGISGIDRILTHQIVRTRIGATYSQQCSGDKDWRHHNVLVPRSIYQNNERYTSFKQMVLKSKMLYAEMLDTMEVPILDARRILPHCLETFIYVKFNLTALMTFIKKRDCVQTQEPTMVILARKMREAVIAKFPALSDMLRNECERGSCFYTKSDRLTGTSMFIPDKNHDFDYNKNNFIYDKTVHEMVFDLPSVTEETYIGLKKER